MALTKRVESKAVAGGFIDCYIARRENDRKRVDRKTHSRERKQIQHGFVPVIPVVIHVGKRQESTLALCDSGARLSFIDKTLADKLNAHGEEVDLSVAVMRTTQRGNSWQGKERHTTHDTNKSTGTQT